MKAVAALAALAALTAAFWGAPDPPRLDPRPPPAPAPAGPAGDWTVVASAPFTSTMLAPSSLAFELEDPASALAIRVSFGPSAFLGFRFAGVEACEGTGPGGGVFSDSAQWDGGCGGAPAGLHELTWTLDAGLAQGTVTVMALA